MFPISFDAACCFAEGHFFVFLAFLSENSLLALCTLKGKKVCQQDLCGIKDFWLITNTKFTSAAINYGSCVGLNMLSWDYPKSNNLHDRIQRYGVYPITVLQSISAVQAEALMARNIVLCKDILQQEGVLRHLHLSEKKRQTIIKEVHSICNHSA